MELLNGSYAPEPPVSQILGSSLPLTLGVAYLGKRLWNGIGLFLYVETGGLPNPLALQTPGGPGGP